MVRWEEGLNASLNRSKVFSLRNSLFSGNSARVPRQRLALHAFDPVVLRVVVVEHVVGMECCGALLLRFVFFRKIGPRAQVIAEGEVACDLGIALGITVKLEP